MSWSDFVQKVLTDIRQLDGPWAVLFVIAVWLHLRYVHKETEARLRDKDEEIRRIVTERDRLQEIFLSERKSSLEGNELKSQ
jgi:hypothetical protein